MFVGRVRKLVGSSELLWRGTNGRIQIGISWVGILLYMFVCCFFIRTSVLRRRRLSSFKVFTNIMYYLGQ
jgi:hypothetical protein